MFSLFFFLETEDWPCSSDTYCSEGEAPKKAGTILDRKRSVGYILRGEGTGEKTLRPALLWFREGRLQVGTGVPETLP